jgi:hypothetical protein
MMRLDNFKKRHLHSRSAVSFGEPEAHSANTDPYMAFLSQTKEASLWSLLHTSRWQAKRASSWFLIEDPEYGGF